MIIKEEIASEMNRLSKIKDTVFLGENIINSGRIYGTMNDVPINKCIEMPVAENLIAGTAIGLAIKGYLPICIFQRMDFMLIAADQIINHACVYPSFGVRCPVIFRTIKADLNHKFYVGLQHSKDLTHVFTPYINIRQIPSECAKSAYQSAERNAINGISTLIVEDYQSFGKEINGAQMFLDKK